MEKMDIQYLLFLQNIRVVTGGVFDEFFNAVSKVAVDVMPFLPFVIFWCVSRKWGYRYLLTLGLGDLINGIVKLTVCAYRPWIRSAEIQPAGDSKTAATVVALLGGHWGNLTARFILWFFVVAVWPVCIRKWTKNES